MDEKKNLDKIVKSYDSEVLSFINTNADTIMSQLGNDSDYNSGKSELPQIPVFDQYLPVLQKKIEDSLPKDTKYLASKAVLRYKQIFYRSSLPNLAQYSYTH